MKANAPRRKVFTDAIDVLSDEPVVAVQNVQTKIPVDKIVPFHNHPFRLYEGERLEDMVESIREHGVLSPVIVQKIADGYEMLAGHNRWNASKIVGIKEIPAIVKEGLTEEEAYVYVIETNLMQRSFTDLLPSEKAAVLAERYEKISCQGKRNDIIEEIARLNGMDVPDTCGHDVHKSKSRDSIGEDYGMTGRNIARYMRLNQTTEQIKEMVDAGTMAMVTAVELSYLSEEEQKQVCKIVDEHGGKIKNAQAMELHNAAGSLTEDKVKNILVGEAKEKTASDTKLFADIRKKYFKGKTTEEVFDILEQALASWFAREGMWMFDTRQFDKISSQYFNIILLSEHDVTIQSRNTGHYWYLHNTDYPAEGNCVIFHKHKASHPYHLHGRAGTLPQAVRSIKKHGKWQMNWRR